MSSCLFAFNVASGPCIRHGPFLALHHAPHETMHQRLSYVCCHEVQHVRGVVFAQTQDVYVTLRVLHSTWMLQCMHEVHHEVASAVALHHAPLGAFAWSVPIM
jgi:hypothetical protein